MRTFCPGNASSTVMAAQRAAPVELLLQAGPVFVEGEFTPATHKVHSHLVIVFIRHAYIWAKWSRLFGVRVGGRCRLRAWFAAACGSSAAGRTLSWHAPQVAGRRVVSCAPALTGSRGAGAPAGRPLNSRCALRHTRPDFPVRHSVAAAVAKSATPRPAAAVVGRLRVPQRSS